MGKLSDEWRTPNWLFDELNQEFNFDIDLCATAENSKCRDFCIDYLSNYWRCGLDTENTTRTDLKESMGNGQFIRTAFCNPPYSNPKPFIEKAWEDSKHCKIVCLVKCDPSTKIWNLFYDGDEGESRPGCKVKLITRRINFDPPKGLDAFKKGASWYVECDKLLLLTNQVKYRRTPCTKDKSCPRCKGKLISKLPGTSFPSALLIFDRGNIND